MSLLPGDLIAFAQDLVEVGDVHCPQKYETARPWLEGLASEPSLFLEYFGRHLPPAMLARFEPFASDACVRHFLSKFRGANAERSVIQRRNRRMHAGRTMIAGGDVHFSESAMAERDQVLFSRLLGGHAFSAGSSTLASDHHAGTNRMLSDMLISAATGGRCLRSHDRRSEFDGTGTTASFEPARDETYSGYLDDGVEPLRSSEAVVGDTPPRRWGDSEAARESRDARDALDKTVAQINESDGDDDDDNSPLHVGDNGTVDFRPALRGDETRDECLAILRRVMLQRFVDGADAASFDYASVDNDPTLDLSVEAIRDHEEAYFDDDA